MDVMNKCPRTGLRNQDPNADLAASCSVSPAGIFRQRQTGGGCGEAKGVGAGLEKGGYAGEESCAPTRGRSAVSSSPHILWTVALLWKCPCVTVVCFSRPQAPCSALAPHFCWVHTAVPSDSTWINCLAGEAVRARRPRHPSGGPGPASSPASPPAQLAQPSHPVCC